LSKREEARSKNGGGGKERSADPRNTCRSFALDNWPVKQKKGRRHARDQVMGRVLNKEAGVEKQFGSAGEDQRRKGDLHQVRGDISKENGRRL